MRINLEALARSFVYDIVGHAIEKAQAEGAENAEDRAREILERWAEQFVEDQDPMRRMMR